MSNYITENLLPVAPPKAAVAPQPQVDPEDLQLDDQGVAEAAKRLGMSSMRASHLRASHTLGKALKKVGVIKIGRTLLYSAATNASNSVQQVDDIINNSTDDALRVSALEVKQKLLSAQIEGARHLINSAELDGTDEADRKAPARAFAAGQPVVIAQQAVVNNS